MPSMAEKLDLAQYSWCWGKKNVFFLAELGINICNIFKCVQTRKYAHCIPLVKRTGMHIIGLSSVPRGNYNRNKVISEVPLQWKFTLERTQFWSILIEFCLKILEVLF